MLSVPEFHIRFRWGEPPHFQSARRYVLMIRTAGGHVIPLRIAFCPFCGRNLSVTPSMQPTIKVPAGYKFTVRVTRDIRFDAAYEPVSI